MATKNAYDKQVKVLEENFGQVNLAAVIDNTPTLKSKIPEGYEVLARGVWFIRVNPDFVRGNDTEYPVAVFQDQFHYDDRAGHDSDFEHDLIYVQDFVVIGQTHVVAAKSGTYIGCGVSLSKGSVRLRVDADSILAVKR